MTDTKLERIAIVYQRRAATASRHARGFYNSGRFALAVDAQRDSAHWARAALGILAVLK